MPTRSPASIAAALEAEGYLPDDRIAQVVFLAERLDKPVLVEGPAGVGKTELAKALASVHGRRLIRLQCYEGLDEAKALYEWNYRKQLLRIQADAQTDWSELAGD
ncbi:MAG: MoxR family ATPase, partial [Acidimicrobiia bacterium]